MSVKVYPDLPRIYLDMDGPLADFDRYCKQQSLEPNQAKLMVGTYLNLEVTEHAIVSVEMLFMMDVFDIFVLTKIPSQNANAATEKLLWIDKHFPKLNGHLIISPDKGCVGTRRDFLIDDHPEWANAKNFPGEIIPFDTPENPGFSWFDIIQYLSIRRSFA